jgi:hypothetical protein
VTWTYNGITSNGSITGDVAFKEKLIELLLPNELGLVSPYQLSLADPNSPSGWSFGWNQMDLKKNTDAVKLLRGE